MRTKNDNLMFTFEIVNTSTNIVVAEFISTEFLTRLYDKFSDGETYGYWNYLETRKRNICRSLGFNHAFFHIR